MSKLVSSHASERFLLVEAEEEAEGDRGEAAEPLDFSMPATWEDMETSLSTTGEGEGEDIGKDNNGRVWGGCESVVDWI